MPSFTGENREEKKLIYVFIGLFKQDQCTFTHKNKPAELHLKRSLQRKTETDGKMGKRRDWGKYREDYGDHFLPY